MINAKITKLEHNRLALIPETLAGIKTGESFSGELTSFPEMGLGFCLGELRTSTVKGIQSINQKRIVFKTINSVYVLELI